MFKPRVALVVLLAHLFGTSRHDSVAAVSSEGKVKTWEIEAVMPSHPAPPESYLCMRVDLPSDEALKLVGVEPLSKEELVHHMLLYGCQERTETEGVWSCAGHGVCPGGGNQQILYGWAKGAPSMRLPAGVGFRVGAGTQITNLVLQIHFAVERPEQDVSGVKLQISNEHIPFSAGMLMYASSFHIPPQQEEHLIPTRCCYSGFEPAHGFAFRVHTHMLGRSVYLDDILRNSSHSRIVEHSPQLPQGFTPVSGVTFWPGQTLEATCNFNSMERTDITYAGATHQNEMCNLYMITWSELPVFMKCHGMGAGTDRHGPGGVPRAAAIFGELPDHWKEPSSQGHPGQVAGIAKGQNGSVWLFGRGTRVWDATSFTGARAEHVSYTEAIGEETVQQLDQDTGTVLATWGAGTFYMPHMISVDRHNDIWVTDVGLHQVFKFSAAGDLQMTLGERLSPGNGTSFCKPTHVAIGYEGDIYVADGYCNSRVAHFSANGTHLGDFVLAEGAMQVPHGVVLDECASSLAVADREAARVHRFELNSRQHIGTWDLSAEGLPFGLAAGPYGTLFALTWDRERRNGGASKLLLLHSDPGQGVEASWVLDDVASPHSLAIIAGPARLGGTERPIAALVGETRIADSRLHKFILVHPGTGRLPSSSETADLGLATQQWSRAFAAISAQFADNLSPGIDQATGSTEQGSIFHSHHESNQASAAKMLESTEAKHFAGAAQSRGSSHSLLVLLAIFVCCGGVALVNRHALRARIWQP